MNATKRQFMTSLLVASGLLLTRRLDAVLPWPPPCDSMSTITLHSANGGTVMWRAAFRIAGTDLSPGDIVCNEVDSSGMIQKTDGEIDFVEVNIGEIRLEILGGEPERFGTLYLAEKPDEPRLGPAPRKEPGGHLRSGLRLLRPITRRHEPRLATDLRRDRLHPGHPGTTRKRIVRRLPSANLRINSGNGHDVARRVFGYQLP